ncbi:MAG: ribonuclease III [Alphaproteobacteria bacterium PA2]|nr:MAG: ribonuclease III [Alphaproteobacteria bacterium PA2]
MNRRAQAVADLQARIGHQFADMELLERALTHSSVGNGGTKIRDNERLEFLGDRVLNLLAAEQLTEVRPAAREGELSRCMNQLVNSHTCARISRNIGLRDAMRVDASASKVGARDSDRVLGDACEAIMAALYLDGGLETARLFFRRFWADEFNELDAPQSKDSKTLLQEWAMGRGLPAPDYVVVDSQGPSHAPIFTIEVRLPGFDAETARGGSKREAEKAAAALMLAKRELEP